MTATDLVSRSLVLGAWRRSAYGACARSWTPPGPRLAGRRSALAPVGPGPGGSLAGAFRAPCSAGRGRRSDPAAHRLRGAGPVPGRCDVLARFGFVLGPLGLAGALAARSCPCSTAAGSRPPGRSFLKGYCPVGPGMAAGARAVFVFVNAAALSRRARTPYRCRRKPGPGHRPALPPERRVRVRARRRAGRRCLPRPSLHRCASLCPPRWRPGRWPWTSRRRCLLRRSPTVSPRWRACGWRWKSGLRVSQAGRRRCRTRPIRGSRTRGACRDCWTSWPPSQATTGPIGALHRIWEFPGRGASLRDGGAIVFYRYGDVEQRAPEADAGAGRLSGTGAPAIAPRAGGEAAWTVDPARHGTVLDVLEDWGAGAGWSVVWKSGRAFSVGAEASFRGGFLDAVDRLLAAPATRRALVALAHEPNRHLVIHDAGAVR